MSNGTRATVFTGVSFAHVDLESATRLLLSPRGLATAVPWRLVNTYCISLMTREQGYATVLRGDGVNLADGKPVAWVLRTLSRRGGGRTMPGHVRGPSFFTRVLDEGRRQGIRHYLLGGTPETLEKLQAAIAARFPGVLIVGAESPPFRTMTAAERSAQDRRIRASGADLVWVGLGTPRQDIECQRLAATVDRPALAVGAAFDFFAGTKTEAPIWAQQLSLEWLFRFASEPRRLWHRYTVGLLRFALIAAREVWGGAVVTPAAPPIRQIQPGARLIESFSDADRLGA
jgi:N-acetylglucosaminyldiphosphoundecaprenol N-acetyl-beta-D-mannosaminyltransferase